MEAPMRLVKHANCQYRHTTRHRNNIPARSDADPIEPFLGRGGLSDRTVNKS